MRSSRKMQQKSRVSQAAPVTTKISTVIITDAFAPVKSRNRSLPHGRLVISRPVIEYPEHIYFGAAELRLLEDGMSYLYFNIREQYRRGKDVVSREPEDRTTSDTSDNNSVTP